MEVESKAAELIAAAEQEAQQAEAKERYEEALKAWLKVLAVNPQSQTARTKIELLKPALIHILGRPAFEQGKWEEAYRVFLNLALALKEDQEVRDWVGTVRTSLVTRAARYEQESSAHRALPG